MIKYQKIRRQMEIFLNKNSLRLIFVFLAFILFLVLGRFPYFNLIFTTKFIIFSCGAMIAILFSLKAELLVKISVILLLMALFFTLISGVWLAEMIGELIYGLIILAAAKKTALLLKEKND